MQKYLTFTKNKISDCHILLNNIIDVSCKFYEKYFYSISIISLLLFRLSLDFNYIFVLSPVYFYQGFVFNPSIVRIILSWLVTIISLIFILPLLTNKQSSSIFILLISLVFFYPLQTLYAYMGFDLAFYFFSLLYWFLLFFANFIIPIIILKVDMVCPLLEKCFPLFSLFSIILVIFISWKYTGFRIITDLSSVYDFRSEALNYQWPPIINYFFSFLPVVLSILMLWSISQRKHFLSFILFVTCILHFSINGMKSTLFLIPLVLIGAFFYKKNYMILFPLTLTAGCLASILEYLIIGSPYITSYIFNRNMALPVYISSQYFEYFTKFSPDFLRSGVLRWIGFESKAQMPIGNMMGYIFDDTAVNLCNGLIGDALYSFGFWGIFILPFIVILCIRILDACTSNIPVCYTVGIVAFFTISFINASWSSNLLSGGLLISCILYLLWSINLNSTNQQKM